MHLVVDAVAVDTGSSGIVVENVLRGWVSAAGDDTITVLSGPDGPAFALPEGVRTVRLARPRGPLGGLWLRSVGVRRAAARLHADAVLVGVPASSLAGTAAPRAVILYDLRHEVRPQQFPLSRRIARRVSWGWSLRTADAICTISERTLDDLRRRHPRLARHGVAAVLGADHVDGWPPVEPTGPPYALAFGHFANKNAGAVVEAWAHACRHQLVGSEWSLRLVGMGERDRAAATERVAALGVSDRVELMPWLDDDRFRECFAGARLVVYPSDFEGFGLPAVEAMRMGIPVVVSADLALAEVTGGHAVTTRSVAPEALAEAIAQATVLDTDHLDAARRFTDRMTWQGTAATIRRSLVAGPSRTADAGVG
ncbi:glycosyltransferase involved in cell wall biosynthesis [Marmoricola sp. URHA0025 HA25]